MRFNSAYEIEQHIDSVIRLTSEVAELSQQLEAEKATVIRLTAENQRLREEIDSLRDEISIL